MGLLSDAVVNDIVFERPGEENQFDPEYAALKRDLAANGWRLREVADIEPSVHRDAVILSLPIEVYFRFVHDIDAELLRAHVDLLVAYLWRNLRQPKEPKAPKRIAKILGSRGELLKTVELDEQADDK
jgi:hypothetical protein